MHRVNIYIYMTITCQTCRATAKNLAARIINKEIIFFAKHTNQQTKQFIMSKLYKVNYDKSVNMILSGGFIIFISVCS